MHKLKSEVWKYRVEFGSDESSTLNLVPNSMNALSIFEFVSFGKNLQLALLLKHSLIINSENVSLPKNVK